MTMKLFVAFLLMACLVPSFSQEAETNEGRTRAARAKGRSLSLDEHGAAPERALARRRDLKGKGSSKSKGSCELFYVYYLDDEFKKSFDGDGLVGTNEVDFYDARTDKKLGFYQEATTAIGPKDCYSNGVYSFKPYDNRDRPRTQVFIASTCLARNQAVIGGTGKYFCATGYVKLENRGANNKKFRYIKVCDDGC